MPQGRNEENLENLRGGLSINPVDSRQKSKDRESSLSLNFKKLEEEEEGEDTRLIIKIHFLFRIRNTEL